MRWLISLIVILPGNLLQAQSGFYQQSLSAHRNQQYDSAFTFADKAIRYFNEKHITDSLVLAYVHKADMVWSQTGISPALGILDNAIALTKKLPRYNIATVALLNKKAQIHVHNAETEKSRQYFALALHHVPPDAPPNDVYGSLYTNISWLYLELQDFAKALENAETAKKINEQLHGKDARQLVGVYQSLLLITHDAGAYAQSEQYATELQRLANIHFSSDHPGKGLMHNDIGTLYESMHRYDEALFHRQQMVNIMLKDYAKHKNPQLLAIAYNNMGNTYHTMGELQLAEDYFEKAVQLHKINFGADGAGYVRPLIHLANIKKDLGKLDEAESLYTRAYTLQKNADETDWRNMAYAETQYGDLFYARQQYKEAETWYKKALTNHQKAGIKGTTIVEETRTTLGETYARSGRANEALALLGEVLIRWKKVYPRGNIVIAGQYNKISETWLLAGQPGNALQYSDSVFMELLQVSSLPKADWISMLPYNYHIIRYLQHRSAIQAALYLQNSSNNNLHSIISIAEQYGVYLEHSLPALRTQASLIQLAQQHKQIYNTAIEACWQLQQKQPANSTAYWQKAFDFAERSKGLLLRLAANNIMIDANRGATQSTEATDLAWRKKISSLNAQYLNAETRNDSLLTLLTASMEAYYRFQDSILHSGEQESIKQKYRLQTAGISQVQKQLLSNGQTLVEYVITSGDIFAFVITANGFSMHQLSTGILKDINTLKNLYDITPEKFVPAAGRCYDVLIKPLKNAFSSTKLVVVPDAELFYLNFELLLPDQKEKDFGKMHYLLNDYEIVYQLSATNALLTLARRHAPKKAMLVAPVFTDAMKQAYLRSIGDSSLADPQYFNLLRLPFSVKAAKQIGTFISNDLFAEQDAVESVFRQQAGNYQVLHLGTHAEVNDVSPLQSRFFLAKQIPSDSTGRDDGYLHAYEIYAMQLQADLAVLTACETGAGNISQGEGVMSLAHSFMYAGCPSVIMSLWKIDEKASADIITRFYDYLSQGKTKTEALRLAKLQHIKNSGGTATHPYFWAGMTLMGNEQAIYSHFSLLKWLVIAIVLIVFVLLLYRVITRKRKTG